MARIPDHEARGRALLVFQFRGSPRLNALLGAFLARAQELEDAFDDLKVLRWLGTAAGAQLDGLGEIVDEPRLGREDAAYRQALLLRIFVNASKGLADQLIFFVRAYTGSTVAKYEPVYPAGVRFTLNGAAITPGLISELERVLPVAVGLSLVASDAPVPFAFAEETGPQFGGHMADDDLVQFAGEFVEP